jgi:hypothetical protein
MDDLLTRLESLAGPDRDVDLLLGRALGVIPQGECPWDQVPEYTRSVDVAGRLIPEGFCWGVQFDPDLKKPAFAFVTRYRPVYTRWDGESVLPAIALCVAAVHCSRYRGGEGPAVFD